MVHTYEDLSLNAGEILTLSTELLTPSPFFFGYQIEEAFITTLQNHTFDKLFFITEKDLYYDLGASLFQSLQSQFNACQLHFVPAGETSKSFSILETTCNLLIESGVSKKSLLISFGGGAVGNMVGMAAGLIYRGIRFIEIPTTFTGQTDSTLSNKQAINSKWGKNHFGFYHAPVFIWSDTQYLKSEPPSSTRSGLIEGIKNGFIANPPFLHALYERLRPELDFSEAERYNLAYNIIQSKLDILRQDPSEKEYGLILEYGHTFGHAIEWLKRGELSHGESVSFGMCIAAELSHKLGFISEDDVKYHYDIIRNKLGFDNPFPPSISADMLMDVMIVDNKKTGDDLRFIILEKIGKYCNPEGDHLLSVKSNIVKDVVDKFIAEH